MLRASDHVGTGWGTRSLGRPAGANQVVVRTVGEDYVLAGAIPTGEVEPARARNPGHAERFEGAGRLALSQLRCELGGRRAGRRESLDQREAGLRLVAVGR